MVRPRESVRVPHRCASTGRPSAHRFETGHAAGAQRLRRARRPGTAATASATTRSGRRSIDLVEAVCRRRHATPASWCGRRPIAGAPRTAGGRAEASTRQRWSTRLASARHHRRRRAATVSASRSTRITHDADVDAVDQRAGRRVARGSNARRRRRAGRGPDAPVHGSPEGLRYRSGLVS